MPDTKRFNFLIQKDHPVFNVTQEPAFLTIQKILKYLIQKDLIFHLKRSELTKIRVGRQM